MISAVESGIRAGGGGSGVRAGGGGSGVPLASQFSPADLDGVSLRAWYDASDTATITGSPVSAFNDKSSNALHLSQGTGARQPGTGAVTLNGLNVLTFDGGDDLIASAVADWKFLHDGTAHLIIAVVKFGTGSNPNAAYGLCGTCGATSTTIGNSVFFDDRAAVPRNEALVHFVARGVGSQGSVDHPTSALFCTPNQWNIVTVLGAPTASPVANRSLIAVNGGRESSANTMTFGVSAANPTNVFALGSCGNFVLPMVGQFAEMIITNNHGDVDALHPYLSNKYGLGRPYAIDIDGPVVAVAP